MSYENNIDDLIKKLESGRDRLRINDDVFSERYKKNIKVIKDSFPNLYEEIKDYSPENKNIFLQEDGSLNLIFPSTGCTVYPENAFSDIDNRYKEFRVNPSRAFVSVGVSNVSNSMHERYMEKIATVRMNRKAQTEQYHALPDMVGGIVLFGFEFGYQLVRILDDHFAKHIYIYEENVDFFYYSLFAIDWVWVVEEMLARDSTLHFYIGVDEKEFSANYMKDLRYNGLYMAGHTYFYMSYNLEHLKKVTTEFSNQYVRQIMGWGFFDDGVIGISQYLARKKKTYLAVNPEPKKEVRFSKSIDLPVMIIGNGPSLDNNIDFIKENIDDMVLVSCGTTINTLYKYGIKPDYHADVERLRHTAEKLEFINKEFLTGITSLTVNVMHPDFYNYFDINFIGLKPSEPISSIMKFSHELVSPDNRKNLAMMHYSSPIVANLAMSYMTSMGFSDIYLAGVDCGFKDPDNHHSKASGYYKNDGSSTGLTEFKGGLKRRDANFHGSVFTTSIMDTSRVQLELSIRLAKKSNKIFQCYNLSDGVRIEGAEPILQEDILISKGSKDKKCKLKKYVVENFSAEEDDSYGERSIGDVYEEYKEFTHECLHILKKRFHEKSEVLNMLSEYNSLLMQQYFKGKPYNCELMIGSFTYFANEILDLVLSTPDDTLAGAREMVDIFVEFVEEMPTLLENPLAAVDPGRGLLDGKYNA